MSMQTKYSIIFVFLIGILILSILDTRKSKKSIKRSVIFLNTAIILPIMANIIILNSHSKTLATLGYYLYYIGMTIVMAGVISFTDKYCRNSGYKVKTNRKPTVMYILGLIDILQLVLGAIFNYTFIIHKVIIDNKIYYKVIPQIGLTIHRIIDYVIFISVFITILICLVRASKIFREKFITLLSALVLCGMCQYYFIAYSNSIDKSVIVHSLFCIIAYYLAIYHRSQKLLDSIIEYVASDLTDSIYIFDKNNQCIWMNEMGSSLLNLRTDDFYHVNNKIVEKFGDIIHNINEGFSNIYLSSSDEYFIIEKKLITTADINVKGYFLVIKNATERRKKIDKEIYESSYDSLTHLHNKQQLYKYIERNLSDVTTSKYIIYINVNNFKMINDIFGTNFGDYVLVSIGNRLNKLYSKVSSCVYGRLVGDTFGVFINKNDFNEQDLLNTFSNFIAKYDNIEYQLFIRIGVYEVVDPSMDISVMFDRAHLAIANSSNKYKTTIKYYDETVRSALLEEQRLITELDNAINNNIIIPYLQPITDVNGNVVGAEALARWNHPEMGFLPPYRFIPLFEKNGQITKLDIHIWESACMILKKWEKLDNFKDLFISINISPKDFYFVDVPNILSTIISKYNINPKKLRIEITETVVMSNLEEILPILNRLKELGFILEIDDFGSGYSSLSVLKNMPIDVLKIDMQFLSSNNEKDKPKAKTIVKNVINMSNDLNIIALTEGVETQNQYSQLIDMGCILFQGYYFAKPMALYDFEKYIRGNNNETI